MNIFSRTGCNLHDIIVYFAKLVTESLFANFLKITFPQNLFSSVACFQISPPSSGKDIIKFLLILFNNKNPASSLRSGKVLNLWQGGKKRGY